MDTVKLTNKGHWAPSNINVTRLLGLEASYVLGIMYNRYLYILSQNKDEQYFYLTHDQAKKLGLSRRKFDKAIERLEEYGIITSVLQQKGVKRFKKFCFSKNASSIIDAINNTYTCDEDDESCTNVQGGMYVSDKGACTNVQDHVQNDMVERAKRTIQGTVHVQNAHQHNVQNGHQHIVQNAQKIKKGNKKNKKDFFVCFNSNTVDKAKEPLSKPVADENEKTKVLNGGRQAKIGFKLQNNAKQQTNKGEKCEHANRNSPNFEEKHKVVPNTAKAKKVAQNENIGERQKSLEAYWAKELEIAETMPPQMRSFIKAKVRLAKYFNKNPHVVRYLLQVSMLKATKSRFWEIAVDWLAHNGNNPAVMSAPENYVHSKLLRWLNNQRIFNISRASEKAQPRYYKKLS